MASPEERAVFKNLADWMDRFVLKTLEQNLGESEPFVVLYVHTATEWQVIHSMSTSNACARHGLPAGARISKFKQDVCCFICPCEIQLQNTPSLFLLWSLYSAIPAQYKANLEVIGTRSSTCIENCVPKDSH